MAESLINKRTGSKIDRYLTNPSQGLLLVGPEGSGKFNLARQTAVKLLKLEADKLDSYAYFSVTDLPEGKKEIPIESIRNMVKELSLQVPGKQLVRRVVVIKDAHLMNSQAQNAFLKSLEEPAPGTVFILTSNSKAGLLPTISSRVMTVEVNPLSLAEVRAYYKDKPESEITSAWALSQGAAGLLHALLTDEDNELKAVVDKAKTFLSKPRYERLLELDAIKDKVELSKFLDGLSRVIGALYKATAKRDDKPGLAKLTQAVKLTLAAQADLEANVTPRLIILKLVLELPV